MKMASPLSDKVQASTTQEQQHRITGSGASVGHLVWRDKALAYWRAHQYECGNSLARLLAAPSSTLVTVLVIAIAVFLPMALVIAVSNIQLLVANWDGTPKLTAYMQQGVDEAKVLAVKEELAVLPGVDAVNYISPHQGLEDFKQRSGFVDILHGLDENPLPAVLIVTPNTAGLSEQGARTLRSAIDKLAIVDYVQYDVDWVRRFNGFMALIKRFVLGMTVLFAVGAILAVGNTIRLGVENRRQEILVGKLVGATHGFVRRPFLYLGVWYGFGGGAVAWLMTEVGLFALTGPIAKLAGLYQADFQLSGFGLVDSLMVLACSALLGWLGAWLTVSHYLDEIEPR